MNAGVTYPSAHPPRRRSEPGARSPTATPVLLPAVVTLAGGVGLVWAGLASLPSRGQSEEIRRGAQLYAATCADCHGMRLEGKTVRTEAGAQVPVVPALGVTGHAWRHSDTTLATIIANGSGNVFTPPGDVRMPAFAHRLTGAEFNSILPYVKSRWLRGFREFQANTPDADRAILAAALRDPSWTFPPDCLPAETR